jgi:cytochrome subunit of sulfide dehydrogenase
LKYRYLTGIAWTLTASLPAGGPVFGETAAIQITQNLASGCSGCHGFSGGGYGSLPAIAGRPSEEFMQAMLDFKADRRKGTVMNRIAKGFSDEELLSLDRYFAEIH